MHISADDGEASGSTPSWRSFHLQTSLKHYLKVQTAFSGSGVKRRAPVLFSGGSESSVEAVVSHKSSNCAFTACQLLGPPTFHATLKKKIPGKPRLLLFSTPQTYNLQHRSAVRWAWAVFSIYPTWFHLFLTWNRSLGISLKKPRVTAQWLFFFFKCTS